MYSLLDFDYIAESLLHDLNDLDKIGDKFEVGSMTYNVIVFPSAKNLKKIIHDYLLNSSSNGGKVTIMGETPSLVDITPEPELISKLVAKSEFIPFTYEAFHESLLPFRESILGFVDPKDPLYLLYTRYKGSILYNLREESDGSRWLFKCNTDKVQQRPNALITLKGTWDLTGLDTINGGKFAKSSRAEAIQVTVGQTSSELILAKPVGFTLEDPNPLLLDRAFHKLPDDT
ncbi:unnamed protein product [Kuraishia capsulata CBS 1993]|uniref:Uncharacterized protein n=1 Tax=Kuraishia capsulata CBS 1993 TaxID=1382522 RepID=W6MN49_9ASCO|nr:uncharacterized protein KUCA_T00003991001 [Kuraishia capsulata CBS 1993]CDK28011.1 unnamed protein product [Kuraishia capsulata CBS 1993]